MNYLVTVSFDLPDVPASDRAVIYGDVYAALATIGFLRTSQARDGTVITLPESTAMGQFTGSAAGNLVDQVGKLVLKTFKSMNLKSTVLITAGEHWAWGARAA
ncbi:MAG: hypothetical protein JO331_08745 [Verrucomicrobia bacterium]|nr:hypothetical protein [Verrucomicrobiota bacterium]